MKILLVSVNAGGGHTAAMYSLLLSLQRFAPYVNVEYFTSPNRILEHMHRFAYTKGSYLYNALYKATAQSTALRKAYFGVTYPSIRSFYSQLAPLLGAYDAVISTHFMQTYALLKARQTLGVPTKIIAYVPDFDHSCIHVPCYAGQHVDAVIAQGTPLLSRLARLYSFSPEYLQRAGFLPRPTFTDVCALSAVQARQRVAALDVPLVSHLCADAFTVVVTGGAYWTMGLYSVLKHLASYSSQRGNPSVFAAGQSNTRCVWPQYQGLSCLYAVTPHQRSQHHSPALLASRAVSRSVSQRRCHDTGQRGSSYSL